jgi:type 1 fimbria pilin
VAGAAIADTIGTFTCTSNAFLAVGQTLTISGTFGGTGSLTGYANSTSYLIATATGGAGTITGFKIVNLDGTAVVTTAGTPTGLTYTISSALAGRFNFTARYTQLDGNIGTTTTYPFGNFD